VIKVLIVDDSPVATALLKHILNSDPQIEVIGTASNGEEAIVFTETEKPDLITMDIIMPRMDGFQATRKIMEANPVPILVVSASVKREEVNKTWRAVEAGAVGVLEKPSYADMGIPNSNAEKLVETVKVMSQVKTVRRWKKTSESDQTASSQKILKQDRAKRNIKIVAIGASTGGPQALKQILSRLPKSFKLPVLIVQHIAPGFTEGFANWMNTVSALPVHIAFDGEQPRPGQAYVAPDFHQMKIGRNGKISLSTEEQDNGIRPSVASLFRSVAEVYGSDAIGVLLTGMGRDGATELKLMKTKGAVTIAQDKESSMVFGMPGEAAKIEAAKYSLPPDKIAEMLEILAQ
jgi:two-component system, chemotaxis family, protein-glutamate methylesterase/glutaminase